MVDPVVPDPTYGLGAVQSPADVNDWDISMLYAMTGADAPVTVPATYEVPTPLPPTLDQGNTPQCVAYSSSWQKAYEDLRDQGAVNFDEGKFFVRIGGGPNGAIVRDAFKQMLAVGYPTVATPDNAAAHKIAAYYGVPVNETAIRAAILAFGPIILALPWYHSWFRPDSSGVLPWPDYSVGGHAIVAVGWDGARGLRLQNSWGADWGQAGNAYLPWSYLGRVWEGWKAVDVIERPPAPPKPVTYHAHVAANATLRIATLSSKGCIAGWTSRQWGPKPSGAPCSAPFIRKGCASGQATLVRITAGAFKGRVLRVGTGLTVYRVS